MTGHNGNLPLHQRTHWRKIREIFTRLASHEGINLSMYNLEKIVCYETIGNELKGSNVKYYGTDNHKSPWVSDNQYEIFEAESRNNTHHNISGKFLFLAHNTSFDYWILAELTESLNKSESLAKSQVVENVSFRVYRTLCDKFYKRIS